MAVRQQDEQLIRALHAAAHPIDLGAGRDLDPVMDLVGDDVRVVLIGEASHGTHEFYKMRADITKRLVRERGFTAVVAEADWPDAWRVNRYVRGFDDDGDATDALAGFNRFPQWMWRNAAVLDFVGWLRQHNEGLRDGRRRCGFYGMDLYSLHGSIRAVLEFLDKTDPEAAKRARYRYACFEHFGEDPQAYGYAASFDLESSCMDKVVQQLVEMRGKAGEYTKKDGRVADEDEFFYAEQNARVVKNAERYYRSMFEGRNASWNLRDRHMVETIEQLTAHLDRHHHGAGNTKVVVWAHNSHLGDARATEMGEGGELNVGQLVRENWGQRAVNIGFSTYTGTVTAASDWDGPAERKRVNPGLPGSYEASFHEVGMPQFLLNLRDIDARRVDGLPEALRVPRLQRAIGVIYLPRTERVSHYFNARLADQFDVMIHIDETRAVEPLERKAAAASEDLPETYPSAI